MDKKDIICFDLETTGLDQSCDEILQLSVIDGEGTILFNEYFKPVFATSWEDASAINGITPEKVKNCKSIDFYKNQLESIFNNSKLIVGYNSDYFDLPFLRNYININENIRTYDVMISFSEIYGDFNEYFGTYRWQKLSTCAMYYNYDWGTDTAHDSLADVRATLYCYFKMI